MKKIIKNNKLLLIGTVAISTLLPTPFVISCVSNQAHSNNNGETPKPPIDNETPKPPIDSETPKPPIDNETPKPPVDSETPKPPIDSEIPKPPVDNETPKPPVDLNKLVYKTSDGFSFNYNGVILGYDGSSNIIDLRKLLVDKDDPNIKVTITEIGTKVFENKKIQKVYIPSSVTKIGDYAFLNSNISELIFDNDSQLKIIGASAFENHAIKDISIPKNVESIGQFAFWTKQKISNQTITFNGNDNLTEISQYSFYGNKLNEIVIPKNVKKIGKGAFRINEAMWNTDHFAVIRKYQDFSYELSDFGASFGGYRKVYFDNYTDTQSKTNIFETTNGMLFDKSGKIFQMRDKNSLENVVIPEKLVDKDTKQGFDATEIGNNLFQNSWRVKKLEIPKTIKKIGDYAFYNNKNLEEFKINVKNNEIADLETIGEGVFIWAMIEELDLSNTKLHKLGKSSFQYNPLKSIKLPRHVVDIEELAFNAGFKGNFVTQNNQTIERDYSNSVVEIHIAKEMFTTTTKEELAKHLFGEHKNKLGVFFKEYN